jgi:glycopeptide antibiotics resistance protein
MVLYAVANGILFVPLGALLPCIWDKAKQFKWCISVGILSSMSIEFCQLILCCGVVQTEDIIMNTAGTAVGYLIYLKIKNNV